MGVWTTNPPLGPDIPKHLVQLCLYKGYVGEKNLLCEHLGGNLFNQYIKLNITGYRHKGGNVMS